MTQVARPGDAIVVRGISTELWKFYLNYAYFPVAWYTYYPLAPDAAPPDAVLDAPAAAQALKPESVRLFSEILPARHARLWHISDQCTDWSFLHLEERWLAGQFAAGPPRRFEAGPCATLVSPFALATAPAAPAARLEWQFGAALRLRGITQLTWAEPARLRPGDSLPLRLEWQLSQPAAADYTLGVYLLDEQGGLKAQYDSWARGGFLAMTHWPLQTSVFDQRSLELPSDLPPGDYQVAVAVYDWQTGQRLPASEAQAASPDGLARVLRVSVSAP